MQGLRDSARDPEAQTPVSLEKLNPATDSERSSSLGEEERPKDDSGNPHAVPLAASLALAVLCVALDNTIVATAIPKINDDFHSIGDAGWYASAYLLTNCTFQLVFGKLYSLFPTKWTFLSALAIFEIGSIVCGAAPNATALIVGRAVSGIGAGGLFSGALIIIAITIPLASRPIYIGIISSMFGLASIIGPIIGGAFAERVTWRLCFYINLPLGCVTAIGVLLFFRINSTRHVQQLPLLESLKKLDLPGILLFIPSVICLLVALQMGGTTWAWADGRIIALFVVSGVLAIGFFIEQVYMGESALVPRKLLTLSRTVPAALIFAFFLGATFFTFVYFLPQWFQVVQGVDAVDSGVRTLGFLLAQVVATLGAGVGVKKLGYFAPFMWASLVLAAVGSGLITTFNVDTPSSQWLGYQIIYGLGIGFGMQQAVVAVQAVVPQELVAMGSALVMFCQLLGGSIFVSVAETVLNNRLLQQLDAHIPGVAPAEILAAGAGQLRTLVPAEYLGGVLQVYNDALVQTFQIGMVMACLLTFGVVFVEWRSIKAPQ